MSKAKGYLAREWNVNAPMATVKLQVVGLDDDLHIKLVTEEGKLFAKSIKIDGKMIASGDRLLENYIDKVSDSSRFFVIKIKNPKSGKVLPIGIGFSDRSAATSLNASVDDFIQQVKRQIEYNKMKSSNQNQDEDDEELWGDFADMKAPSSASKQATANVINLAPPPDESQTKKKKKKKGSKKKSKKKEDTKNTGEFQDGFDNAFSDFGDFDSGNTGDNKATADFGDENWEASFESANQTSSAAPPQQQKTDSGSTTGEVDILGLFS